MSHKFIWTWSIAWTIVLYVLDFVLITSTIPRRDFLEWVLWEIVELVSSIGSVVGKARMIRSETNMIWLFGISDILIGVERMVLILWKGSAVSLPLFYTAWGVHVLCVYSADVWFVYHCIRTSRTSRTICTSDWIVFSPKRANDLKDPADDKTFRPSTCPVCLEEAKEAGPDVHEWIAPRVCLRPHWMHRACVQQWIQAIRDVPTVLYACPVCRTPIV